MSKLASKKGLTLVETIVALMLISIILVSFLTMFSYAHNTIFSMGNKTTATRIAQEPIDQLYERPLDLDNLPPLGTYPNYTVNRTISGVRPDGLYEVTMQVLYRGDIQSVEITALVP